MPRQRRSPCLVLLVTVILSVGRHLIVLKGSPISETRLILLNKCLGNVALCTYKLGSVTCLMFLGVLVELVAFLGTINHRATRPGDLLTLASHVPPSSEGSAQWRGLLILVGNPQPCVTSCASLTPWTEVLS